MSDVIRRSRRRTAPGAAQASIWDRTTARYHRLRGVPGCGRRRPAGAATSVYADKQAEAAAEALDVAAAEARWPRVPPRPTRRSRPFQAIAAEGSPAATGMLSRFRAPAELGQRTESGGRHQGLSTRSRPTAASVEKLAGRGSRAVVAPLLSVDTAPMSPRWQKNLAPALADGSAVQAILPTNCSRWLICARATRPNAKKLVLHHRGRSPRRPPDMRNAAHRRCSMTLLSNAPTPAKEVTGDDTRENARTLARVALTLLRVRSRLRSQDVRDA